LHSASLTMYARRSMSVLPPTSRIAEPSQLSSAIADLFQAHGDRMLNAAHRVTGSLEDAEDVLQSVFVRLVQHPDNLSAVNGQDAGAYLHRAAVNAALDLLRARARRPAETVADLPGPAGAPIDASLLDNELADRLRAGLAGLHPRAAEMVALRYLEELSNQEVAARTGSSESTVAVTLYRARQTLRERMSPKEGRS